ncbi:ribosome-associated GTPase EngA [bacterium]|nr:ribosome-associated GTPase EngA [bacterium]
MSEEELEAEAEAESSPRRLPLVALVGRPNVGKSTLFNRFVGERRAVVEDRAGTTRDRLIGIVEWNGMRFRVVDTGGMQPAVGDPIEIGVQDQARIAVDAADLILLLVDAATGPNPGDAEVAQLLRRSGKPIILVANKADNIERDRAAQEFSALGFDRLHTVSAQHGIGSGDLLDVIVERLEALPEDAGSAYVEAGTTRDAIDETLLHAGRQITLVDTAGIRKRGKVASGPSADKWATVRSVRALDRADVALLLIDASTGLQAQDLHIAGSVIDAGKGLVLVLNKWDLIEKDGFTFDEIEGKLRRQAPFLDFAPLVSISAVTGLRATKVLDAAVAAADARNLRIPTGVLNRLVAEAVARQEPAHSGSKRPKILYAAQASTPPPTFVVFARNAAQVHFTWQRFLENQIRDKYPLMGTPIRVVVREREAEEGRERGRSSKPTKRAPAKAKPATRA